MSSVENDILTRLAQLEVELIALRAKFISVETNLVTHVPSAEVGSVTPIDGLVKFGATYGTSEDGRFDILGGEIVALAPTGCYVREGDGKTHLRTYPNNMKGITSQPNVGDFWVVMDGGFEAIFPRWAFMDRYARAG